MSNNSIANQNIAHENHWHHDIGATKIFSFWIYLMSDLILFACLFATYVVLVHGTVGGPTGKDIFNLNFVFVETLLLLFSSITYGFAMLAMYKQKINMVKLWLFITFLLGFSFIIMESYELHELISYGYGPDRSAFLSAFFTIVGTHGIHVSFGLAWIMIMIIHISLHGLNTINQTRLSCLSLFWHFLDVVWICLFTVVYLLGAIA
ncbi:Cytochrome bo(3) ubiquinol oxidase subunit 3 [Arsenophonus endosymbiont of Aleurodicus dispersus]|uniref:cytochrome o ubiquinol oxidase subunit III n=1 Tax=Arsenophonus endosymbiont of Aleurodicus dispersus TaxID=235559 RepID=UPI000EB0A603|nr:cytochrome o ubiquinol oxidase subunit III [Arsenophonus endosymbiont of Aleurodicus dispersus]VAY02144.1 Cytochrome bo(3) ubiquinol oxidase subunit 3 [Arsenophonus endosymbiont of Aleurodicus dispersus]